MIGAHTVTRESQEMLAMPRDRICDLAFADGDEDVKTLMVDADIILSGQLNITTSTRDNPA